jgi:hypothetical protein
LKLSFVFLTLTVLAAGILPAAAQGWEITILGIDYPPTVPLRESFTVVVQVGYKIEETPREVVVGIIELLGGGFVAPAFRSSPVIGEGSTLLEFMVPSTPPRPTLWSLQVVACVVVEDECRLAATSENFEINVGNVRPFTTQTVTQRTTLGRIQTSATQTRDELPAFLSGLGVAGYLVAVVVVIVIVIVAVIVVRSLARGVSKEVLKCPTCGAAVSTKDMFCANCGAKLSREVSI